MKLAATIAVAMLLSSGAALAGSDPDGEREASADVASEALATLLQGFAAMPGLQARFREEKRMALLIEPLVSTGDIAFVAPDKLRRQVSAPVESLMLMRDGELVLSDTRGSRAIDLASQPMVKIFIDGITLLLAGDLEGLRAHYRIRMDAGDGDLATGWSLHLVPIVAPLDGVIASIAFAGQGRVLRELTVVEKSGDETRTTFSDVGERHFPDDEIERLFRPSLR